MGFEVGGTSFSPISTGAFQEANLYNEKNKAEEFKDKLEQAINSSDKLPSEKQEVIDEKNRELREASVKFEAFFLYQLMSSMRDTIERADLFGNSHERDIYEGMFDEALTEEAAKSGGIGLAQKIYEQNKFE